MPKRLNARLNHIVLGTPDPEKLANFYSRALIGERERAGGTPSIGKDGRAIYFMKGAPKTSLLAAYAFDETEDYGYFVECARAEGVTFVDPISPHWQAAACAVVDPDGNRIEFGVERNFARLGPVSGPTARLQHVVFASREPELLERFYVEKLGFGRSDHVLDDERALRAAFLHTDDEHHAFAIFRAPENRLDHHCYETSSWNDLRDWADHFSKLQMKLEWGPGRHGAGNNLFLFVHDPDGNWLELSAELETLPPERELTFWKHEERTLNLWGHGKLRS